MKILLDTNVVIDFLGRKSPFFEDAERILAAGYFGDTELWVPAQSVKDAFYVLSHYTSSANVQSALRRLLDIAHPVDLTGGDLIEALRLQWDDLEDCLIAVSAMKVGADYLITRDRRGFERSPIATLSPSDWLDHMNETHRLSYDAVGFNE